MKSPSPLFEFLTRLPSLWNAYDWSKEPATIYTLLPNKDAYPYSQTLRGPAKIYRGTNPDPILLESGDLLHVFGYEVLVSEDVPKKPRHRRGKRHAMRLPTSQEVSE